MSAPHCPACHDSGHVCENHPDRPWSPMVLAPEACGCGAGQPCPSCCSPSAGGQIEGAFVPDRFRAPVCPQDGQPAAGW